MSTGSSREVVFLLKTQMDSSIAQGFGDIAQRARATQEAINRSVKESATNQQQIYKEQTARLIVGLREQEAAAVASEKAKEQAARDSARRQQQLQKEQNVRTIIGYKEQEAAAVASEKARETAIRQSQLAERQAHTAATSYQRSLVQLAMGRQSLLLGSMQMARGVSVLFASNEKESAKLLQNLMLIHGAYDLFKGASQVIHGISAAWRAYQASVALAAAAQAASAVAANAAAAAHERDALAANADAVANTRLAAAAATSATAQGVGGAAAGGAAAGGAAAGGATAAGGGLLGGLALPLGVLAAAVAVPALGYTMTRRSYSKAQEAREVRDQETVKQLREGRERGFHDQEQISRIEQDREAARQAYSASITSRDIQKSQRQREYGAPNLGRMMSEWSVGKDAFGRKEPGAAGYRSLEEALIADRTSGQGIVGKYEAEGQKAANDVIAKKQALALAQEAEKKAKIAAGRSAVRLSAAEVAFEKSGTEDNRGRLEGATRVAASIQQSVGRAEADVAEAGKAVEESLKRQQALIEQTTHEKEVQSQRDIKSAEAYITKLKEMREAHLRNADALEKSGQAMAVQLATGGADERHRLMRAMRHAQGGRASDKELGLLARNAAPDKAEQFAKQIESRHPEYAGLMNFLGKGRVAIDAEKAKAADEERRIKQQEAYVNAAKSSAEKAADSMSDRLASVLKELFELQERRFVTAVEKIRTDFANRDRGAKALSE